MCIRLHPAFPQLERVQGAGGGRGWWRRDRPARVAKAAEPAGWGATPGRGARGAASAQSRRHEPGQLAQRHLRTARAPEGQHCKIYRYDTGKVLLSLP